MQAMTFRKVQPEINLADDRPVFFPEIIESVCSFVRTQLFQSTYGGYSPIKDESQAELTEHVKRRLSYLRSDNVWSLGVEGERKRGGRGLQYSTKHLLLARLAFVLHDHGLTTILVRRCCERLNDHIDKCSGNKELSEVYSMTLTINYIPSMSEGSRETEFFLAADQEIKSHLNRRLGVGTILVSLQELLLNDLFK